MAPIFKNLFKNDLKLLDEITQQKKNYRNPKLNNQTLQNQNTYPNA